MIDYFFGFAHHLALGYPEGGFGYGDGEVVDFDAVELTDRDLDELFVGGAAEDYLVLELFLTEADELGDDFVFKLPEREIGFGEEVA